MRETMWLAQFTVYSVQTSWIGLFATLDWAKAACLEDAKQYTDEHLDWKQTHRDWEPSGTQRAWIQSVDCTYAIFPFVVGERIPQQDDDYADYRHIIERQVRQDEQ